MERFNTRLSLLAPLPFLCLVTSSPSFLIVSVFAADMLHNIQNNIKNISSLCHQRVISSFSFMLRKLYKQCYSVIAVTFLYFCN